MIQMPNDRNRNSVLRQLAALQKMSTEELKEKWRDLYGSEPPSFRKSFIQKRLAYRIQELFYGGVSDGAKEKLSEFSVNDPMANITRRKKALTNAVVSGKLLPGTRLLREWNGKEYEVIAKDKGFEYDGREFRSLSAVATEITGTKWNGKLFFGLKKGALKWKKRKY
jgi:hypothetical protein